MGNTNLHSQSINEGEIFIEMNSTTCVGGAWTSGTVHLNMTRLFHTDGLMLRFKGYERSHPGTLIRTAVQYYAHPQKFGQQKPPVTAAATALDLEAEFEKYELHQ